MTTPFHNRWLLFAGIAVISLAAGYEGRAQFGQQSHAKAFAGLGGNGHGRTIPVTFSTNIAAVISPEKDRIWAYSGEKGEWRPQEIALAEREKAAPRTLVGTNLVSLQTSSRVYAFSAHTGQWDVLDVPPGEKSIVTHHADYVVAEYGDTIALFSSPAGRWSALNWKTGETRN